MSGRGAPHSRLAARQPTNSPGTAVGVTTGSSVSASETRSCIAPLAPKLMGCSAMVSTA